MPYRIHRSDGIVEVEVSGNTSVTELLSAVRELRAMDPRKEVSDLWTISEDIVVPFAEFSTIVANIKALCTSDMVGCKTALVANGEFQRAVMDLYRSEAKALPFQIGVFASREQAIHWLKA